jgi:hypothetical protein
MINLYVRMHVTAYATPQTRRFLQLSSLNTRSPIVRREVSAVSPLALRRSTPLFEKHKADTAAAVKWRSTVYWRLAPPWQRMLLGTGVIILGAAAHHLMRMKR